MSTGTTARDGFAYKTGTELAAAIRNKEISPVEVVAWTLAAIDALNPTLNAYLTVDHDGAMAAAREAEQAVADGRELGPLHGLPVSVKDLEPTKGLATSYGAAAYADDVPEEDSTSVARLRAAGGIVIGKTNTPAFGLLGETKNRIRDHCRNPWDTTRMTGGSSGGSAVAVAAGITALSTGTDSAGSINSPAGICGVYGIKGTHGRVPTYPTPGDALLFNDGGPITRSVADAALMLSVMAGHEPRDPASLREPVPDWVAGLDADLPPVRVAWSATMNHHAVDDDVIAVAGEAARKFGRIASEPVEDAPDVPSPWDSYTPLYVTDMRVALADFLAEHPEDVYAETWGEISAVPPLSAEDYVRAYHERLQYRAKMEDFFERYDLLLTTATAVSAFPVGEPPSVIGGRAVRPGWMSFMPALITWNLCGNPAASVPAGFTEEGLPVGLLIVGPLGREDLVLAASAAFERAYPWSDAVPPVSAAGVTTGS